MDSADVFPAKVFSFGVFSSHSSFPNYFDNQGNKTTLGSLFTDDYTFNDILDEEPADRRAITQGALGAYGIEDFSESAGFHKGTINIKTKVDTFMLAFGLTKKLSLFAILPRVKINVDFKNNFTKSKKLNELLSTLSEDGNYSKISEIEEKLSNPVLYKLKEYGYNPNYIKKKEDWGDLRLFSRYNFLKNNFFSSTLGLTLALPTAKTDQLNDFLKLYIGDGQWDVGLQSLNEFKISNNFSYLAGLEYTNQISQEQEIRVPINSKSPLSSDIDNKTKQDFGNIYKITNQMSYKFNKLWSSSLGHIFQYKNHDTYQGNKYTAKRYKYLEQDTLQRSHSGYIALTANTIDLFLKKKFIIPIQASLSYSNIFAGKNIARSEEVQFSLTGFYK